MFRSLTIMTKETMIKIELMNNHTGQKMLMQNLISVNGTQPTQILIGKKDYPFILNERGEAKLHVNETFTTNLKNSYFVLSLNVPVPGPIDSNLLGPDKMFQDRWQTIVVDPQTVMNGGVARKPICSDYTLLVTISLNTINPGTKAQKYMNVGLDFTPISTCQNPFEEHEKILKCAHEKYIEQLFVLTTGSSQVPKTQEEMNTLTVKDPERAKLIGQLLGIDLNIQAKELTMTNRETMPMHVFWKIMPKAQEKFLQDASIERIVFGICLMLSQLINENPNVTINSAWLKLNKPKIKEKVLTHYSLNASESYCYDATVDTNKLFKINGVVMFGSSKQADQQKPNGVTDKSQAHFLFRTNMNRILNGEYLNEDGSVNPFVIGSIAATYELTIGDCEDATYRKALLVMEMLKAASSSHSEINNSLNVLKLKNKMPAIINALLVETFAKIAGEITITPTVGGAKSANMAQSNSVGPNAPQNQVPINQTLETFFENFKTEKIMGHAYGKILQDYIEIGIVDNGKVVATLKVLTENPKTMEGTATRLSIESQTAIQQMNAATNLFFSMQIEPTLKDVKQIQDLEHIQQNLTQLNKTQVHQQDAINLLSSIQAQLQAKETRGKFDSVICAADSKGSLGSFYFGNLISTEGLWTTVNEDVVHAAKNIEGNEYQLTSEQFQHFYKKGLIGFGFINDNNSGLPGIFKINESKFDQDPKIKKAIEEYASMWTSMSCPHTEMESYRRQTLLALQQDARKRGMNVEQIKYITDAFGDPNSGVTMNTRGLNEEELTCFVPCKGYGGKPVQRELEKKGCKVLPISGTQFVFLHPINLMHSSV